MKIVLEFNDDEEGASDAINGWRWHVAVENIDRWLRDLGHYGDGSSDMPRSTVSIDEVRAKIRELVPDGEEI